MYMTGRGMGTGYSNKSLRAACIFRVVVYRDTERTVCAVLHLAPPRLPNPFRELLSPESCRRLPRRTGETGNARGPVN
jgi:hypothetical protein